LAGLVARRHDVEGFGPLSAHVMLFPVDRSEFSATASLFSTRVELIASVSYCHWTDGADGTSLCMPDVCAGMGYNFSTSNLTDCDLSRL
jgi:hypothetical protein